MKLSTLRIEPHIVKPDTSREYYAPKDGVVFWRIWIDDELITERAQPFEAMYSLLELSADTNYPFFGDGGKYVSVRRVGNYIIWTEPFGDTWVRWNDFKSDRIVVFPLSHYQLICQKGLADSSKIAEIKTYQRHETDVLQQMLKKSEIVEILQSNYPKYIDEIAIYREPKNRLDTTGSIILRRIEQAIQHAETFTICNPPEKQIELRIGLDDAEFKEAIWHIGKVDGNFAVWFEKYPSFPFWLQSSAFDTVFNQETFVKELA